MRATRRPQKPHARRVVLGPRSTADDRLQFQMARPGTHQAGNGSLSARLLNQPPHHHQTLTMSNAPANNVPDAEISNVAIVPNASRLLWAGFMAILAAGVGFEARPQKAAGIRHNG